MAELSSAGRAALETMTHIDTEIRSVLSGKDEVIRKVLIAALSGGHVLLEDAPGVGKTTLARAFAKASGLSFRRIQFTPDLLPSDVTGFTMYRKDTGTFEFRPGAAFCSVLLADEINRGSSRTQSALLEVMQEGRVTVDGVTREVPKPFFVLATANPTGTVGTQPLPGSELDRFEMRLSLGYPTEEAEIAMMKDRAGGDPLDAVEPAANADAILAAQQAVREIHTDDRIYGYIRRLCQATREHPGLRSGLSPRAALQIHAASRAAALLDGRSFVTPDDVGSVFTDCGAHRVVPGAGARGASGSDILDEILEQVPVFREGNGFNEKPEQ